MPSWNYRGTRIPELEGDRNQWEQRRRFCLLSASLTASLVRHGGQTPGRKHDKNTRMTKASRSLNVYNTVFWKVQVDWALTGSVLHPFEFRRNTVLRHVMGLTLLLSLRTKQEKWCFNRPRLGCKCKHKCRTGKCPNRICSGTLTITGKAQSVNMAPALLPLSLKEEKIKRWWNRRQRHKCLNLALCF